ncbi:MAG: type I-C CRISPR-associated protein Cas8c/Csd1 [Verrucomicrobiales bacterium]|nr:type I-C CRISPR-associated protein Cas8c/Csd1 [Verrucomicrobiales bacterium]
MIAELIQVADTWTTGPLTGQEPRRQRSVHWFIDLDAHGNVLGLSPTAGQEEKRAKQFALPANYKLGSPNQFNWLPDFLSGPPNEIFPDGVMGTNSEGNKAKQAKWLELVLRAGKELPNNEAVQGVVKFVERNPVFSELPLPELADEDKKALLKDLDGGTVTFSFRVNGRLVFNQPDAKSWWARQVQNQRNQIVGRLRLGQDAFLQDSGPLTDSSPTVFGNVPLASFDKAPFWSYGLGNQTATFRLETAEKAAAALNALVNNQSFRFQLEQFGKKQLFAVFWAVHRTSGQQFTADFMQLLDQPDPLAVRDYLCGIWGKRPPEIAMADFHVAILLKGTGRFSVRSWHTDTLGNADEHVRRYFEAIKLPDDEEQSPALRDLAWVTIAKTKRQKTKPAPATYNALFESAWRGTPLPFDLLAATIERQRVELASGDPDTAEFKARLAARTALVQLYFALKLNNPLLTTSEMTINTKETAILCGRLLALFDKIHDAAHDGKSASSPANRLYGAASATPALVFPRLCHLARYHLQRIGGGWAHNLEFGVPKEKRMDGVLEDFEGLAAVVARLKEAAGGDFPRILSLEDQGRFALGFYYERERCRRWPSSQTEQPETSNS